MKSDIPPQPTAHCQPATASCGLGRRRFLLSLAGSVGVVVLGGCGDGESSAPPEGSWSKPIAAIAAGSEWRIPGAAKLIPGQALAFELPDKRPGLVFVSAKGQLSAISARCTHTGCTVIWQENGDLLCPCHGSRFDNTGRVLVGPADKPLPLYQARRAGDDVVVQVQEQGPNP